MSLGLAADGRRMRRKVSVGAEHAECEGHAERTAGSPLTVLSLRGKLSGLLTFIP